jgi:hypothetical protein
MTNAMISAEHPPDSKTAGHVLGGSSGEGAAAAACDDVPVFGPALPTKASSVGDAPVFGPDLPPSATSGVADVHKTASSSSSEPPSTPAPRAEANSLSTPCAVASAKDAGSAKATARRPPPPSSRRPLTSAQRLYADPQNPWMFRGSLSPNCALSNLILRHVKKGGVVHLSILSPAAPHPICHGNQHHWC